MNTLTPAFLDGASDAEWRAGLDAAVADARVRTAAGRPILCAPFIEDWAHCAREDRIIEAVLALRTRTWASLRGALLCAIATGRRGLVHELAFYLGCDLTHAPHSALSDAFVAIIRAPDIPMLRMLLRDEYAEIRRRLVDAEEDYWPSVGHALLFRAIQFAAHPNVIACLVNEYGMRLNTESMADLALDQSRQRMPSSYTVSNANAIRAILRDAEACRAAPPPPAPPSAPPRQSFESFRVAREFDKELDSFRGTRK